MMQNSHHRRRLQNRHSNPIATTVGAAYKDPASILERKFQLFGFYGFIGQNISLWW